MSKNYNDNNINNDKDDDNNLSLIIVQTAWKLYNTGNSLPLTLRANSTRQSHSAEDAHPQVYADFPETFRWKGIGFSSCVLFVFNNLILFSIRIRIFFRFLPTFCCPLQLSFHPSPFPHLLLRCLFLPLPLFPHPNPSILLSSAFHPFLISIPRPKILSPFRLSWNDT